MFPAFAHFRRTATCDTVLAGQPIAKGEKVVMWYASSNRDESRYEDPDRFDVTRNPEHQAFGAGGRHFCLGTALARLELLVMFEETLARQIKLGVVPTGTKLAPKPEAIKDWAALNADEKKLFARQMEVFAAFGEYADTEIGRLIQAIDATGQLDNTGRSLHAASIVRGPSGSTGIVAHYLLCSGRWHTGSRRPSMPHDLEPGIRARAARR